MPLRPGRCYRYFSGPPYTRLEYIHGAPYVQIPKFDMGATSAAARARFDTVVKLVAEELGQIRMNALESARQMAFKYLNKILGQENFYLRINVYPFHVLRENKMLAMAGADRLQEGMRLAFGSPVGRAVRVEKLGQVIMFVEVEERNVEHAKEALRRAKSKLSIPCRIVVEKKQNSNTG
ncbi:MAG: 50S ribosomal protein L16 [Crenarchaeota archaeon]|nr:50S ribosomal protein L16 [Thermoproteota archaeon]